MFLDANVETAFRGGEIGIDLGHLSAFEYTSLHVGDVDIVFPEPVRSLRNG